MHVSEIVWRQFPVFHFSSCDVTVARRIAHIEGLRIVYRDNKFTFRAFHFFQTLVFISICFEEVLNTELIAYCVGTKNIPFVVRLENLRYLARVTQFVIAAAKALFERVSLDDDYVAFLTLPALELIDKGS